MPPVANVFDQSLIKGSNDLADTLLSDDESKAGAVSAEALQGWDSAQIVILLERFISKQKESQEQMGSNEEQAERKKSFGEKLQRVDKVFNFTQSKNSEIRFRWLTV